MYATNLSEIDRTLYQIVYHSRGNPRPPLWQVLGIGAVAGGPIKSQSGPITLIAMNY